MVRRGKKKKESDSNGRAQELRRQVHDLGATRLQVPELMKDKRKTAERQRLIWGGSCILEILLGLSRVGPAKDWRAGGKS